MILIIDNDNDTHDKYFDDNEHFPFHGYASIADASAARPTAPRTGLNSCPTDIRGSSQT